ncbi:MAG: low molecular weight protein arginine phosphatase [candidate division WOR-3 bacterium]|nr:low molecular weight protein arginine phosphatase [candidate division WOR-3 bacterium]MCX7757131.1 low molecular weight protein arginine phosphatase [candidate division WOR-3 bacterium]MDW7987803.1 low molecular weight protein arginine phosphatase [candidate division WOR-3 bacterium]
MKGNIKTHKSFTILFVCSGNSCRSPMAEALMKKILNEEKPQFPIKIRTASCGTIALNNMPPSENAVKVLSEYGIDLTGHRTRRISKSAIKNADLILVMEKAHKEKILEIMPNAQTKTFLISEFASGSSKEIVDPIGMSINGYRNVANDLYDLLKKIYKKLLKQLNSTTKN